jgi:glycosyltransferase involved in cell wall biosynthesis
MLAIIIPYFKRTFFEATLQSIANQTDMRFKVYIGDDASPENPSLLLEQFEGKFNFIYKRFETNLGGISLVQQWKRCVELMGNEDWFMILGDDDALSPVCVEYFYKNFPEITKNNCNVVRFASVVNDTLQQTISPLFTHPKLEKSTNFICKTLSNKTRSSLSEYVFKNNSYKKYGFHEYDLAWHSDDRAWLEFSEFNTIYSINSAHIIIGLSNENISRGNFKMNQKQLARLEFFKFLIFDNFNKFTKQQRKYLIMYYEQLVYQNKKTSFLFWVSLFLLFLKNSDVVQSIKFTRRLLIYMRQDE